MENQIKDVKARGLERMPFTEAQATGLSVQDLVAAAAGAPASPSEVPTVSEYLRRGATAGPVPAGSACAGRGEAPAP